MWTPGLMGKGEFADWAGISLKTLNYLLYALKPGEKYRTFDLQRRNGTLRTIRAPILPLKTLQKKIADMLMSTYRPRSAVHGFVFDRSIISNGAVHERQEWVLRVDIKDFFPSINFGRVRGLFLAKPYEYNPVIATTLAQVCCHKNELPQGAPTSPVVSNLICRGLDADMARLAREERCYYTRYCDDLTLSTNRRGFPERLARRRPTGLGHDAGEKLSAVVEKHGFELNPEKTVLRHRSQRQLVTGIVTNRKLNVRRKYVASLRNLLYIWEEHGEPAAEASLWRVYGKNRPPDKPKPLFRDVVRGRVQYVGSVKGWYDRVYKTLAGRLEKLDDGFRRTVKATRIPVVTMRVFTEGWTDQAHLLFAYKKLRGLGELKKLELEFKSGIEGDKDLLTVCKAHAKVRQDVPHVFIFDRDNPSIISKVSGDVFKDWGNRVFSMTIGKPSFRKADEPLCIEMLHRNTVLKKKDDDGRRIYLRSEFDKRSGRHNKGKVYCSDMKAKGLIKEEVWTFDGKKVGLSKKAFAERIRAEQPPYGSVSVEGFRPTFKGVEAVRMKLLEDA